MGEKKGKESKVTSEDAARRIQSDADKKGTNEGFKKRAQSAAAKKKEK